MWTFAGWGKPCWDFGCFAKKVGRGTVNIVAEDGIVGAKIVGVGLEMGLL